MFVLNQKKYSPEGDNGDSGAGVGDSNPATSPSGASSNGSAGGSGDKSDYVHVGVLDRYKQDLAKAKEKARANAAELEKFRAEEKTRQEQSLLDEKNYQELLSRKDADLEAIRAELAARESKIGEFQEREIVGTKVSAFMEQADFKVDSKYLSHIDLSKIELDDSGEVVMSSVKAAVDNFKQTYPEICIQKGAAPRMKQPGGEVNTKITMKEYQELYRKDKHAAIRLSNQGLVKR